MSPAKNSQDYSGKRGLVAQLGEKKNKKRAERNAYAESGFSNSGAKAGTDRDLHGQA